MMSPTDCDPRAAMVGRQYIILRTVEAKLNEQRRDDEDLEDNAAVLRPC